MNRIAVRRLIYSRPADRCAQDTRELLSASIRYSVPLCKAYGYRTATARHSGRQGLQYCFRVYMYSRMQLLSITRLLQLR